MKSRKIPNRVAIIGCKDFSAENLYSLLMNGIVNELVLVEDNCENLLEEISYLQNSIPLAEPARVFKGTCKDAARAKIAVIAAGRNRNTGESSIEWLTANVEIVREIVGKLKKNHFDGVFLIVANPVDILAQVVLEESGSAANKVIGSGKILDKEKFRKILNEEPDFKDDIEQEEIATWCAARMGNSPLIDYCQPNCPEFGKMIEADKRKPTIITRQKDSSLFAAGSCVTRICESILRDERTILPVSTMTDGQYRISGVFMNLPCIIRRDGIEDVIQLKISESEKGDLLASGDILKRTYKLLEEKRKSTSA